MWKFPEIGIPEIIQKKSSRIVLKAMVLGIHHFRKPPYRIKWSLMTLQYTNWDINQWHLRWLQEFFSNTAKPDHHEYSHWHHKIDHNWDISKQT